MDVSRDTVKNNLKKLSDGGYIVTERKPYGVAIEVMNSKKWMSRQGENSLSREGENSPSDEREGESSPSSQVDSSPSGQGENSLSESRQGENSLSREGENSPSNGLYSTDKTEKQETTAAALASLGIEVPPPEFDGLLDTIMVIMGRTKLSNKELELIKRLLRDGVPPNTILTTLEEKLQEYAAANGGRYFNSFCYCEVPILEKHKLNTNAAKLELVHGFAQTAAMRSPGVKMAELDPVLQEKRKRMEAMQRGNAGTIGRPPA